MNKYFCKFHLLGILAFLAMIAVFSVAATLLWNALMPELFGLPTIRYGQALGLTVLARIFFGGLGVGHFWHGRDERLFHRGNHLREKWMHMTKEERRAFFEKEKDFMRFHRGFSHPHDFFDGNGPEATQGQPAPQGDGASQRDGASKGGSASQGGSASKGGGASTGDGASKGGGASLRGGRE